MRDLVKTFIVFGVIMLLVGLGLNYKQQIYILYRNATGYVSSSEKVNPNDYYREYDFEYVQNVTSFQPNNFQDILNIFYTVINAGESEFTFYCPFEYKECIDDVKKLVADEGTLSDINNFVHPFNAFKNVEVLCGKLGDITIIIEKTYSFDEMLTINSKLDFMAKELINESDTDYNNILRVHDYLVNNAKYDKARSDYGDETYRSDTAYGLLFEGMAVCSGYTDAMQLMLERMKIKSYRVASEEHVWNAVYVDGEWYNLDLTWDDPVMSDGSDFLDHKFFLIKTDDLLSFEKDEHNFNQDIYKELKGNA